MDSDDRVVQSVRSPVVVGLTSTVGPEELSQKGRRISTTSSSVRALSQSIFEPGMLYGDRPSDSACNRPCVRRLPRREEAGTPTVAPAARCGRSFGEPQAIEQAGALLRFLPPYSPDFNPIELAFAKLKAFLRAARPRTFDHVCQLMAAALGLFMPDECANYVRHCGYRITT